MTQASSPRSAVEGARLQRRPEHPRPGAPGARPAAAPRPAAGWSTSRWRPSRWSSSTWTPARSTWRSSTARPCRPAAWASPEQLKDEIYNCPPVLVLIGRAAGRVAGDLVARRGGRAPPARPDAARRRRRQAAARAGPGDLAEHAADRHTWPEVLSALIGGADLTAEQATWAMGEILAGAATPSQIAGFAVALRAKGETIEELSGLVEAMYAHAVPLRLEGRWLDVVGTGGDRSMSVNISTMAAIVAAGAGARVVKHGNRSASSKSGAADVLEALGVRLDLSPEQVDELGRAVPASPSASPLPSTRRCATRRCRGGSSAVGTTFNFLGPAREPGAARRPGDRLRGRADGAADGRGLRPPRGRRLGVPRRRRPRRADHDDDLAGLGGRRTARSPTSRSTPRTSGCPEAPPRTCAVGTPRTTPTSYAGSSPGSRGRSGTPSCSTPARRWRCTTPRPATPSTGSGPGSPAAAEAVDSGAARQALDRWVESSSSCARRLSA